MLLKIYWCLFHPVSIIYFYLRKVRYLQVPHLHQDWLYIHISLRTCMYLQCAVSYFSFKWQETCFYATPVSVTFAFLHFKCKIRFLINVWKTETSLLHEIWLEGGLFTLHIPRMSHLLFYTQSLSQVKSLFGTRLGCSFNLHADVLNLNNRLKINEL